MHYGKKPANMTDEELTSAIGGSVERINALFKAAGSRPHLKLDVEQQTHQHVNIGKPNDNYQHLSVEVYAKVGKP